MHSVWMETVSGEVQTVLKLEQQQEQMGWAVTEHRRCMHGKSAGGRGNSRAPLCSMQPLPEL